MLESLFNEVAGLRHVTMIKKRLWHRNFKNTFFTEIDEIDEIQILDVI